MSRRARLRLPAPQRVRGWIAGEHPSVHQGRSADYDDIRQYEPGDDVRDIDWKATARSGSLILRRHVAEHLQRLLLVVDTGVSMTARSRDGDDKSAIVTAVAQLLGAAAVSSGDLVALLAGDSGDDRVEPPRRGRIQLHVVGRRIDERLRNRRPSDVAALLTRARRLTNRRQLVAVISDEAPMAPAVAEAARKLRLRNDVLWVTIADADLVGADLTRFDLVDVLGATALPAFVRDDEDLVGDYVESTTTARRERERTLRRLVIPTVEIAGAAAVYPAIAGLLEHAPAVPDDLYPATGAPGWWIAVGIGLVALAVGWTAWVWWSTRLPHRRNRSNDVEQRRRAVLGELDELAARHADGELSTRQLFQNVSPLVRQSVVDATGEPAHAESLADHRARAARSAAPGLDRAVAAMYPEEFAADSPGAIVAALEHARTVVTSVATDQASNAPAAGGGE